MNQHAHEVDPGRILAEGSEILGTPIDSRSHGLMLHHLELLHQWNTKINLTSLTEKWEMAVSHFLDSLTVFKVISMGKRRRVIDVGTGAGFPGLVLHMADPCLAITLMDKDPRKIVFLKHVVHDLRLEGVQFMNRALNDIIKDTGAPRFDVVVSRAFSSNPHILDLFASLLDPGGVMVRMAGPASIAHECVLTNFRQTVLWEGTLPFSNRFRRVIRYSRAR